MGTSTGGRIGTGIGGSFRRSSSFGGSCGANTRKITQDGGDIILHDTSITDLAIAIVTPAIDELGRTNRTGMTL